MGVRSNHLPSILGLGTSDPPPRTLGTSDPPPGERQERTLDGIVDLVAPPKCGVKHEVEHPHSPRLGYTPLLFTLAREGVELSAPKLEQK